MRARAFFLATAFAGAVVMGLSLMPQPADAGITGTAHDFRRTAYAITGEDEICAPCHAPHNNNTPPAGSPLWNHNINLAQTYTLYTSDTMDATPAGPGGVSRLCLSCHDGVLTVGDYNGAPDPGIVIAAGATNLGTDLSNDHPVGMAAAGAGADPNITVPAGYTLYGPAGDQMECGTCHNPHSDAFPNYLRASNVASAFCLSCHVDK